MMQIIDTAIDLMRRKHKKGEFYYWILYYAYLSPQQCENAGAILQSLETKGISISLRTTMPSTQVMTRPTATGV